MVRRSRYPALHHNNLVDFFFFIPVEGLIYLVLVENYELFSYCSVLLKMYSSKDHQEE